jgi:hypothetical protein
VSQLGRFRDETRLNGEQVRFYEITRTLGSSHEHLKAISRTSRTGFENNQGAIVDSEQRFTNHNEDLISMVRNETSSMKNFFESHLVFHLHWLWKKDAPDAATQRSIKLTDFTPQMSALIFILLSLWWQ